jgi:hypothetical protein
VIIVSGISDTYLHARICIYTVEILILDIHILFTEVHIFTGHESMVLHWCKPVNKFERLFHYDYA